MSEAEPTWSQTTEITGPRPAEAFYVGVQCMEMPTDGRIGFTIAQPDPMPPIVQPMVRISNPNMSAMVKVSWPDGGTGSITIEYQEGATQAPASARISRLVLLPLEETRYEAMAFADRAPAP